MWRLVFGHVINTHTAFPFEAVWNVVTSALDHCHIFKAKLALSSLLYGNDEILLHVNFNLTG